MKDVVSFETAKRLKAAGFPQPEKLPGQIWYGTRYKGGTYSYELPFLVGNKLQTLRCSDGEWLDLDDHVFAPSATDILKELGRTWNLYFDKMLGREAPPPLWACTCDGISAYGEAQYHENPAEACAAAYLSIHEKSANQ